MNYSVESFLIAFALTNAIEFFPVYFFVKHSLKQKLKKLVLINSITLPIVWLVFPFFFSNYFLGFFVIEFGVVVAETFLAKKLFSLPLKNAFLLSFLMNFFSAIFGFLL
jgi:hypothetical protein